MCPRLWGDATYLNSNALAVSGATIDVSVSTGALPGALTNASTTSQEVLCVVETSREPSLHLRSAPLQ